MEILKTAFIKKAELIYQKQYTYNKVIYVNANSPVIITCKVHGDFVRTPSKLINSKRGCPKCKIPVNKFTELCAIARKKFNDRYTYTDCIITNKNQLLNISCPVHGMFKQSFYNHLKSTTGCPQCGIHSTAESKRKSLDSFIKRANIVHGNKYDYSKTVYTAAKEKVTITCPIHGDFQQLVSGHLAGYGCKECTSYGKGRVDVTKPCILYYLHLPDLGYYKLGITTRTIEERYRTAFDRDQFQVVFTKNFPTGQEAYDYEQTLFKVHQALLYKGPKVLHTGNTEIFITDIFKGNYPS